MPWLRCFVPALHHALVKTRANPPPELSAGVERQSRDYLIGLKEGKVCEKLCMYGSLFVCLNPGTREAHAPVFALQVRPYPMGDFESKPNERGNVSHHRVYMDAYLRSYFYSPAFYLLSAARARQMVEKHSGPEELQEVRSRSSYGGQREAGREATSNTIDGQTNTQKVERGSSDPNVYEGFYSCLSLDLTRASLDAQMQQLVDLVLICKRNAENEVIREAAGREEGTAVPGRKRRLEQETAERALKFLKASQEPRKHGKIPGE